VDITRTIRFLDTFRFMPSSLDKLESNFTTFLETKTYVGSLTSFRKDVYSYVYLDSFDKFNEPLPRKEAVYSSLEQKEITKI